MASNYQKARRSETSFFVRVSKDARRKCLIRIPAHVNVFVNAKMQEYEGIKSCPMRPKAAARAR